MENIISKTLTMLGLSKLEARLFLTLFKLGPSKIPEIAKRANIKRSTAYLLTKGLIERGFLIGELGTASNLVQTISPDELQTKISAKQRTVKRTELEYLENLNSINSIYQSNAIRPKVRVYQGNEGLLTIWKDILSTKNEILLWTNQQTENEFFGTENHNKFIKERLVKKIHIRVLATESKEAYELQKADAASLRQTKILPPSKLFSAEIYLYDNKVAILDYNKDVIGTIVESASISATHREIFEMMWNALI